MGDSQSKPKIFPHDQIVDEARNAIDCMTISKDRSLLAVAFDNSFNINTYSTLESRILLGVLRGHTDNVRTLCFMDAYLVSGSDDNSVKKWDLVNQELVTSYEGHTQPILKIVATDSYIFSSSYDKTVNVWEFDGSSQMEEGCISSMKILKKHTKAVTVIIFIPAEDPLITAASDTLITAASDGLAISWDLDTGAPKKQFKHSAGITCMTTDPSGKVLFTACSNGDIKRWSITTGIVQKKYTGHQSDILSFALSGNNRLYTASKDGKAFCFPVEYDKSILDFQLPNNSWASATLVKNHDGYVFIASGDGNIYILDENVSKYPLETLEGKQNNVVNFMAIAYGKVFAASHNQICIYDVKKAMINYSSKQPIEQDLKERSEDDLKDLDDRLNGYLNESFGPTSQIKRDQ